MNDFTIKANNNVNDFFDFQDIDSLCLEKLYFSDVLQPQSQQWIISAVYWGSPKYK